MNTTLKSFSLALLLTASSAVFAVKPVILPPVPATDSIPAEKLALATQVVKNLNYQQQWEDEIQTGYDKSKEQVTPSEKKDLDAIVTTIKSANITEPMAKAYAQLYSTDELNQLLNFYSTPVGQEINRKNKLLAQKYEQIKLAVVMNATLATTDTVKQAKSRK